MLRLSLSFSLAFAIILGFGIGYFSSSPEGLGPEDLRDHSANTYYQSALQNWQKTIYQ